MQNKMTKEELAIHRSQIEAVLEMLTQKNKAGEVLDVLVSAKFSDGSCACIDLATTYFQSFALLGALQWQVFFSKHASMQAATISKIMASVDSEAEKDQNDDASVH